MKEACGCRLEFAMEAPGFVYSFRCAKIAGHEGQHACHSTQRQRQEGTMQFYRVTWSDTELPASVRINRRQKAA